MTYSLHATAPGWRACDCPAKLRELRRKRVLLHAVLVGEPAYRRILHARRNARGRPVWRLLSASAFACSTFSPPACWLIRQVNASTGFLPRVQCLTALRMLVLADVPPRGNERANRFPRLRLTSKKCRNLASVVWQANLASPSRCAHHGSTAPHASQNVAQQLKQVPHIRRNLEMWIWRQAEETALHERPLASTL